MPRKKVRKKARRPKGEAPRRKHTLEKGVEDFAEEMGSLRERASRRARQGRVKRLYRSGRDRILGGVCGGIAEYFRMDPVLIRLLWVLFALVGGAGVLLYIIAWIIIPRNPRHKW